MQTKQHLTVRLLAMMALLASLQQALAQPTIISTIPTNGATGVSPGAAVVFTFSTAMNPTATSVIFSDVTANFESPTVGSVWSAGNMVLTCTSSPAFANNHNIQWEVSGQDTMGNFLAGYHDRKFHDCSGRQWRVGRECLHSFSGDQIRPLSTNLQCAASAPHT